MTLLNALRQMYVNLPACRKRERVFEYAAKYAAMNGLTFCWLDTK